MTDVLIEEIEGYDDAPGWARHIIRTLNRMEDRMTSFANDQAHLDADIQAIATEFATVVAELKAAASTNQQLDFTKADALVQAITAEAVGDAPASGTGSVAPSAPGGVTPVDPTQPVNPVTGTGASPVIPPASDLPAANAPVTTPPSTVNPDAPAAGETNAPSEPVDSTDPSVPAEPVPAEPVAPPATDPTSGSAAARTLYEHTGTGDIDTSEWTEADETAADGTQLYFFAGDTQPGDANGLSADWTVYSGPTAVNPPDAGAAPSGVAGVSV